MTEVFDAGQVQVRSAKVEAVDEDQGIIDVRIVPYEHEAQIDEGMTEVFTRAAFAGAVGNPSRCKVTGQQHDRAVVIGSAIELRDAEDALYGRLQIVDTVAGNDVLKLLRPRNGNPPALDEMSVEFRPMRKHMDVRREGGRILVRHNRAELVGVSPVSAGAYGREARVLAVRAAEADRERESELAYLASLTAGRPR